MISEFFDEYAKRSDDELLHLASQRHSLTPEAANALDTELRRRNLTEADWHEHQRLVREYENSEARKHRRKPIAPFKNRMSGRDFLWFFGALIVILVASFELPNYYPISPEWQETMFIVTMTSVLIAILCREALRDFAFWISLTISTAIHVAIVHAWSHRTGAFDRNGGRAAFMLGLLTFLAVYKTVRWIRHKRGQENRATV